MTVLAYRSGILAADSVVTLSDTKIYGRTKVFRRADGVLYGSSGNCSEGDKFRQWVADGEKGKFKLTAKTDGVIIRPDGEIFMFDVTGVHNLRPTYWAAGSGGDYALGALYAGASAVEAVEAALMHNAHCGGPVHFVSHTGRVTLAQALKLAA